MNKIIFDCEVVTPMFLSGADGTTPELRAPSLKGALRFWWRALNGHLPEEILRKREGMIFGDTSHRSCFSLQISSTAPLTFIMSPPVPHRGFPAKAITPGSSFSVTFIITPITRDEIKFGADELQSLFELTVFLGGIGKRVRRGMGSFKINKIGEQIYTPLANLNDVLSLVKKHTPNYTIQNGVINLAYSGRMQRYPWIQRIETGELHRNITNHISTITHNLKGKYGNIYEPNLGHASNGRFASPVYVSVLADGKTPVVTTLNTVPDRNKHLLDSDVQGHFITDILNKV